MSNPTPPRTIPSDARESQNLKPRRRKAIRVVRIIARLNVGGPAKHVVWLADESEKAGITTYLVSGEIAPGEDDMAYFAKEHEVQPIKIGQLGREISLKDVIVIWKLFWLFWRIRPDVVHTHTAKAGAVGRIAGVLYRCFTLFGLLTSKRCRFVHTFHGHVFHSYYGNLRTWFFLRIERLLAWCATDGITVLSDQQFREIHEEYRIGRKRQFNVIPLGIDMEPFNQWQQKRPDLRRELGAYEDEILIGTIGRLTEIKNHWLFLVAASLYMQNLSQTSCKRVRFVIIGDGHLRQELEQQAKALGLADNVAFLGSRDDPEVFYPGLDIVALTSSNEGTPLSIIEGMACARPVIATQVGGVPDLLGPIDQQLDKGESYRIHERGLAVYPNFPRAFAEGLSRLVRDEDLRQTLGQRGSSFVREEHTKARLADDTFTLYRQLLGIETGAGGSKDETEELARE